LVGECSPGLDQSGCSRASGIGQSLGRLGRRLCSSSRASRRVIGRPEAR
jgi:hypothetical protein